jgi:hypothetical protein
LFGRFQGGAATCRCFGSRKAGWNNSPVCAGNALQCNLRQKPSATSRQNGARQDFFGINSEAKRKFG